MDKNIKQLAINKLAISMRMYLEANLHVKNLQRIDIEDATNNLDRAFETKLEAFHSLYDVTKDDFKYFDNADTALLIMLRNAIHHRDHSLFKSWNFEMCLNNGINKNSGAEFLMVSHTISGEYPVMENFYRLNDFYTRIDSPFSESKIRDKNKLISQLKNELNFNTITDYAKNKRYPIEQIYINIIPIFMSAVCKVFKALKGKGVKFEGSDAEDFEYLFTKELEVDMADFIYTPVPIIKINN